MKIALGADHRGRAVLTHLEALLSGQDELAVSACADCSGEAIDYTDMALPVCMDVAAGRADRGILICATGLGSSITANKVGGIRAALVQDELGAEMARRCMDANVLCLAADLVGPRVLDRIVMTFLTTGFDGGRHERRLEKLAGIERQQHASGSPAPVIPDASPATPTSAPAPGKAKATA